MNVAVGEFGPKEIDPRQKEKRKKKLERSISS